MKIFKEKVLNPIRIFVAFIPVMIATGMFYSCTGYKTTDPRENHIKPYTENRFYWQYNGQPLLLLGATDNDNLFQDHNLESHLDSLKAIGGNYIRNTMSDRDPYNEKAFFQNADGLYDLNKWNDAYWDKFENMLKLTSEREIIVQIEIWDRFDHSRDSWLTDPYNPKNNINYTFEEAKLDSLYPKHPGANEQPFFFTVPESNNNEIVLNFQQAFVKKLLSHSLKYGNVLYCIDNETSGTEEWATYWAGFIKENSDNKEIYITQMWDHWDIKSDTHKRTLDHPERYGFIDIAQNSHNAGFNNWENAQFIFNYINDNPRPVNSTKIYGNSGYEPWLNRGMTSEHAVETFFRNIIGGFASSRFHRPPAGLGLSFTTIHAIKTVREIEELVKLWELTPRMDLLSDVDENEAYISADEGEKYVIYFPGEGNVSLDLKSFDYPFTLRWINTYHAEWIETEKIEGGRFVVLQASSRDGSLAVITRR